MFNVIIDVSCHWSVKVIFQCSSTYLNACSFMLAKISTCQSNGIGCAYILSWNAVCNKTSVLCYFLSRIVCCLKYRFVSNALYAKYPPPPAMGYICMKSLSCMTDSPLIPRLGKHRGQAVEIHRSSDDRNQYANKYIDQFGNNCLDIFRPFTPHCSVSDTASKPRKSVLWHDCAIMRMFLNTSVNQRWK